MKSPAEPRTIAVDLTPVLPGGENGGAKVFTLELVRGLARVAPHASFVLLTQAASHDELAALDAPNVRRVQAIGPAAAQAREGAFEAATSVLRRLPAVARRAAARAGYVAHARLKRAGARKLLRELRADLLFCPFTAPAYASAGIPTVCTIYDVQFRAYPQFFAVEDAAHRESAFLDACRRANALVAISAFSREAAIREGRLDPRRIRAIPLHAGREAIGPAGGETPAAPSAPYLLYPANFWKHKNHEMLLAAFALACGCGLARQTRLVCTGTPGARQRWLARAAAGLGLADRVDFPGYLDRSAWSALLRGATGVVFPSLYEGFGLPVVEAMAAGIPVACADTTALPEVAGGAALLFDPRKPADIAAAMVALAGDPALRARLVAAGAERAAHLSDPDAMARAYWDVFRECA